MSNVFDFVFDATQVAPDQGGVHPIGRFPFVIKHTEIKPNQQNTGGYLEVVYDTPAGVISDRFNKWHENPQTVKIADAQLSALCHVTGVYRVTGATHCAELRGARGQIDVAAQIDKVTKQPNGYTQVVQRLDVNGNPPGKAGAGPAAPQPQQQPFGGGTPAPIAPQPAPAGFPQQGQPAPAYTMVPAGQPANGAPPAWVPPQGAPAPAPGPAPGPAPAGWPQQGPPASAGPAPAWGQR